MLFSICVATYKRPELLEKLLSSLINQFLPGNCELEIIIVDNDSQESARKVFDKFNSAHKNLFSYYVQKEKNISLTRNLAVAKAQGEYILFIDDDEYAEPDWIAQLIKTIETFKVAAVFGRVVSYFDEGTPEWVKKSFIYNRPSPPTGTNAKATRTGNCIVKSSLLRKIPGPFNVNYGISGGSDTHLFQSLRMDGAKYCNCYEAVTYEYVPRSRTTNEWLLLRAFRGGNDFTRHSIQLAPPNKKFVIKIKHSIVGITYIIISFLLTICLMPSRSNSMHWRLKLSANFGKVSAVFGHIPKEYA